MTVSEAMRERGGELHADRIWRTLVIVAAAAAIIVAGICVVIKRDNQIAGDGFEYVMMSQSLLSGGDLSLDAGEVDVIAKQAEAAGAHMPARLARALKGIEQEAPFIGYFRADNGRFYSNHFLLYPIVNAPALALTRALGISPYRSVFITNVVIFGLTVLFIVFTRYLSGIGRLMLLAAYILGGTSYYLRWAGPEVLVGSLSIVGLVSLLAGHYFAAGLALALAAQHDPPVGLLALVPLAGLCLAALRAWRARALSVADVAAPIAVAAALVASPVYFYTRFGFPNPHAAYGHAVSDLVSADRVVDLLISPDLGIVRAMPWLFPALIAAIIALAVKGFRKDALMVAVLPLAAAAALAAAASSTTNWNSGMVVFSRYGVFAVVPLWIGLTYAINVLATRASSRWVAAVILAVFTAGQLATVVIYNGFGARTNYTAYSRASLWLLENYPRFYNPIPETFVERGAGKEGLEKGNVFVFARDGQITKILFNQTGADTTLQLCGVPLRDIEKTPGFVPVPKEDGWIYLNPEGPCPTELGDGFSLVKPPKTLSVLRDGGRLVFASGGTGPEYLLEGWSQPEAWGVWSQANRARLEIPFSGLTRAGLRVTIHMASFDRGDGKGQQMTVTVGGVANKLQLAGPAKPYPFEIANPAGSDGTGSVSIVFDLPEATSPASISISDDPRQLGVALRDISIAGLE
jgi:hypothetical protein